VVPTKRKSIVPLNDPDDSFRLFGEKLVPSIVDVRGEEIAVDFGDYVHGVLDHPEMPSRVNWIVETLRNPEEIRRHWDKRLRHREIYVNTIYQDREDRVGEMHLVIVQRTLAGLRFWTTFIPQNREKYTRLVKKGELLWKPKG